MYRMETVQAVFSQSHLLLLQRRKRPQSEGKPLGQNESHKNRNYARKKELLKEIEKKPKYFFPCVKRSCKNYTLLSSSVHTRLPTDDGKEMYEILRKCCEPMFSEPVNTYQN